MKEGKSFQISQNEVLNAYKAVKASKNAGGVDGVDFEEFEKVGTARQRCYKMKWVVEFDIVGLFDNIDHTCLMQFVKYHSKEKWVKMYIERC